MRHHVISTLCLALAASQPILAADPPVPDGTGEEGMSHDGMDDGMDMETVKEKGVMDMATSDERAQPADIDLSTTRLSGQGLFEARVSSEIEPIEINRIHRWTLHVETADGAPVTGAVIAIDGGMPIHDHGLPTAPEVTAELGGGDYLVEGMKFQMPGHWVVTFDIEADGVSDSVTFELML